MLTFREAMITWDANPLPVAVGGQEAFIEDSY